MFIMIDGIDGSCKSTVIDTWKDYLIKEGNGIFDLKKYWKENKCYPEYKELRAYEFIFSGEPTYTGMGALIREELIRNGTDYPLQAVAQAFSLDRLILYKKIIIPALKDDKCIIQDRGVTTSLCYQVLSGLSLEEVAKMPGNALALEYPPNHLVLMQLGAQEAIRRLQERSTKQDDVMFEKIDFQRRAAEIFDSPEYQQMFTVGGTQIHRLSAEDKIDIMKAKAIALLKEILKS